MQSLFYSAMSDFAMPLLAQMSKKGLTDQDRSEIFFWLTVLIIIAVIASVIGFLAYRKIKKADETTLVEQDFSLSQVRRLYEAGEVSHEEFMQVRERILEASRRQMLDMKDTMPRVVVPEEASEAAAVEDEPDSTIKHDDPPTNDELQRDEGDERNRET